MDLDIVSRACTSKRAYPTRREAQAVANHRSRGSRPVRWLASGDIKPRGRRTHKPRKKLRAYHCPHCNAWHLCRLEAVA